MVSISLWTGYVWSLYQISRKYPTNSKYTTRNNKVNIKIPKNVVKYNKLLTFTAYSLACYVYKKMVQYVYALASNNWHNNTHVLTDKRESYQEA